MRGPISFYGMVFLGIGWLVGIMLLAGQVTYYQDGHSDGLMRAIGGATLALWGYQVWRIIRSRSA